MNTKTIQEIATAVGALGALVMAWGSAMVALAMRSYHGPTESHHRREKVAHLVGALLVAAAFVGILASLLRHPS